MRASSPILLAFALGTYAVAQTPTDEAQIKNAVLTFYEWYISTTRDGRYSDHVRGVEDESGMTRLETRAYFRQLDSLGVVGRQFIERERERFRPCDSLLRTVPWAEFSSADAYAYDSKCDYLYYFYWTFGQEAHDHAEVTVVTVGKNAATAVANLYYSGDNRAGGDPVKVFFTRENGRWLISSIDRPK